MYDATGIVVSEQALVKEDKTTRVSSGELYSDNGVVHDDTLYMQPPCPSEEALNTCHNNGKSLCTSLASCTWCKAKNGGKCFPGGLGAVCANRV